MFLRTLNDKGIKAFTCYLETLHEEPSAAPPYELLEDEEHSELFDELIEVEAKTFDTRFEFAEYMNSLIPSNIRGVNYNGGLWAWLTLLYFDQLAPEVDGIREILALNRYIITAKKFDHRHLLAGAFRTYRTHGSLSRLLLGVSMNTGGDVFEQFAYRGYLPYPNILKAAHSLYFEPKRGREKVGATNSKKPGTLRRFFSIIDQLDTTYDLYALPPAELLGLIPNMEFKKWLVLPPSEFGTAAGK